MVSFTNLSVAVQEFCIIGYRSKPSVLSGLQNNVIVFDLCHDILSFIHLNEQIMINWLIDWLIFEQFCLCLSNLLQELYEKKHTTVLVLQYKKSLETSKGSSESANWSRSDNSMVKWKKTKGQTIIWKYEPH